MAILKNKKQILLSIFICFTIVVNAQKTILTSTLKAHPATDDQKLKFQLILRDETLIL
ncbi:hypothetical protein [Arachidicoccus ginsenosidimutans]|uniref:hypothetical protein n=1 Tax=Arachidicoccus sp. BS20 TaxID=1850526 RepID=UPI0012E7BCA1|nr:hypothetical protein [Arachidicoccus sp. BS20]